jgi:hypothetical protein
MVRKDRVCMLQAETYRAMGEVRQIITDDKGTVAILVFGLQAMAAAASLGLQALCRISLTLQGRVPIGVTTSDGLFFGAIGCAERCEAAIVGNAVNMAARICCKCGVGVHCDEATALAVANGTGSRGLEVTPLPPIKVKGRDAPLPVYGVSLLPATEAPQDEAAAAAAAGKAACTAAKEQVIGREAEIKAAVEALLGGQRAPAVVISATAGTGKSALLGAVLARCREAGVAVAMAAGDVTEQNSAFFAVMKLGRELSGPAAMRFAGAINTRFGVAAGLLRTVLLLLLPAGAGVPWSAEQLEAAEAAVSVDRHQAAVTEMLAVALEMHAAETGGLILAVEDHQWFDASSRAVVEELAAHAPSVRLVVATRPQPSAVGEGWAQRAMVRIELAPLTAEASGALIASVLGASRVEEAMLTAVLHSSQGVPLFTLAVTRELLRRGIVSVADGVGRLADADKLPSARFALVEQVLEERMASLGLLEQELLKRAAVFGRRVPRQLLESSLLGRADETVIKSSFPGLVATLVAEGFVHAEADGELMFQHDLLVDVAYSRMLVSQRLDLHQRVASSLLARCEDGSLDSLPFPTLAQLAHHCKRAGNRGCDPCRRCC